MISEDSEEAEINFEVEGIKKIPFISNRTFSPAKFVPGECDGLLCLSPYSSYEMPFLRYNHPPAVIRVESDELIRGRIIQPTLDKYFLLRGYDALCFDSSWTRDVFLKLVPFLKDEFPVIQGGINHELFKPIEKVAAKNNIAEAFANPKLKEKPIFLIIPGESIEESVPFITELASSFPGVAFLVLDPFLGDYVKDNQGNLEFFKVQDAQDNDVMSVIFNAADIAFFPMAFLLGYVPSDKSVRSRAIQLPSFRERPLEDALATTLLVEHTPAEVEAVLTHIFKEQKKAKEILRRVSTENERR